MTYAEAIQFLYGLRWFGAKFGLENTQKLAALAGNPQNQLRFIHVAGTNGKGSTCAMLESIYRAAGLRVGLFTSPHLVSFRERVQVNRGLISEADVVRLVDELRRTGIAPVSNSPEQAMPEAEDRRDACPTFFEFITVLALKYFVERRCELVIWETGMGGRLDATNIVTPLASVITNIGYDHQKWLGNTLAQIAAEKAGIIKPGVPVLTATDEPEALAVIEKVARAKGAPLTRVGPALRRYQTPTVELNKMEAGAMPVLRMLGEHQRLNAALAVATIESLQARIPVSKEAIRLGLETVHWPGRMQLVNIPSGQAILLDGAHNVAGAKVLRAALSSGVLSCGGASAAWLSTPGSLKRGLQPRRDGPEADSSIALVLGVLADKDCHAICEILAPLATRIVTVPVASDRTALPAVLLESCRSANPNVQITAAASLADALDQLAQAPFVVITGSLYLVGEAMERLNLVTTPAGDEKGLNEWNPRR